VHFRFDGYDPAIEREGDEIQVRMPAAVLWPDRALPLELDLREPSAATKPKVLFPPNPGRERVQHLRAATAHGHRHIATTERYLHHAPDPDMAARLSGLWDFETDSEKVGSIRRAA
jgi:hypothetical protein